MKKILFYYHHFGGLGHGTRINALCKAIKSHNPYCKIVVLNSGKPQPELKIGKYAKVIDLPYFEAKEGLFSGLSSQESIETTFKKRKAILYAIAEQFKPDLAIFEHFPFGRDFLGKEIIDFIKKLKYQRTLIYSSVRDIIEQEVDENKLDKRLDFFNAIFVHSDKETGFITSFRQSEKLKDKLIFTGRVFAKSRDKLISKDKIRNQLGIGNNKLIVASIGGGNDGYEILNKLIKIKKEIDNVSESLILITTGNSISKSEFEKLKEKADTQKDILITKFNPNYFDYLNAADISISMGGYNSINNALLTDTQTIIVPRDSDSEQKIRAKTFSDFFKIMTFEDLRDNDKLRDMIIKLLQSTRSSQYINIKQKDNLLPKLISNMGELKSLKIRLTNECNCRCDMCTWIKEPKQSLPLHEIKKIINDAEKIGVNTINLTGGEPTVHPDFKNIIQYLKRKQIRISLSTNLGFNEDILNFIVNNKINHINFSLDFNNSVEFNKARGRKGLFQKIENNLRYLNKTFPNVKFHLNFTIRKDNLKQAPDLINFAKKYNINSISFHLMEKNDLIYDHIKHILLSKNDLIEFYFDVVPNILKNADPNMNIEITPFISQIDCPTNTGKILKLILLKDLFYIKWLEKLYKLHDGGHRLDILPNQSHIKYPCNFNHSLRINMDGEYSPCCTFDDTQKFTNIYKKSLIDFWVDATYPDAKIPFKECYKCLNNKMLF